MAANNFITTTTLWDTEKKKSLFVQNTAKISPPQPLWKKNGRSGFCDSVHVSTRPSSRVQMMPKPWQNTAKKQCVTWGYTLPYCTLNVSGSLIPVGESHDPHESPGTSSASWCVMPLAALHTWSFWGRCKAGRAIGPLWAIGENWIRSEWMGFGGLLFLDQAQKPGFTSCLLFYSCFCCRLTVDFKFLL